MNHNVYIYILVMAAVTYLIRMMPLVLSKKEITSPFVKSFLFYVPYACLAAMTFPAILTATSSVISAAVGFAVALIAAYREKSLLTVALQACLAVFLVERLMAYMPAFLFSETVLELYFARSSDSAVIGGVITLSLW